MGHLLLATPAPFCSGPVARGGHPHRSSDRVPPDARDGLAAHCCRLALHYACVCLLPLATHVSGPSVPPRWCLPHARCCSSCSTCPDACLALFRIKPSAVSPWMAEVFMQVWRAAACSHDGLALHGAWKLGLPRRSSFGCLHRSAHDGTAALLCNRWPAVWSPWRSPGSRPKLDSFAEYLT